MDSDKVIPLFFASRAFQASHNSMIGLTELAGGARAFKRMRHHDLCSRGTSNRGLGARKLFANSHFAGAAEGA
jgi:hypothetical protein